MTSSVVDQPAPEVHSADHVLIGVGGTRDLPGAQSIRVGLPRSEGGP